MATRKKRQKIYFTKDTENAIVLYNNSIDEMERNIIYTNHIHAAFDKLAENIIHTFKFYHFDVPHEDVKQEVVSFLIEKIDKYSQDKGKAFSYFSIVAKNYLIAHNNLNYQIKQKKRAIEVIDSERNIINEHKRNEKNQETYDFTEEFVIFLEKNIDTLFIKSKDIEIAEAVKDLFKNRENIENYNKKALYILIRERTNAKTQNITFVINYIKELYLKLYEIYCEIGSIKNINTEDLHEY
jgi:hypothetical protein